VAEKFAAEGSNIAINYVLNEERAKETAAKIESEYKVKVVVIQGVCLIKACILVLLSQFAYERFPLSSGCGNPR